MIKVLFFVILFFNNVRANEEVHYDFDYNEYNSEQTYEYIENNYSENEEANYQENSNEYMAHDERIFMNRENLESFSEQM